MSSISSLPDLPVIEALPGLRAALAQAGCAVLAAPPGSGKTTVVPLALLDEVWLAGKTILMLEPRRVAARAAAARMAWLLNEKVGARVGYQIRFEKKISAATRIEVVTEGLLTRRLQADAELPGVGLVIFDEFHERSLDADLALALTLDARANLNPDLRVLVMSATLDTERVAALLDGAPIIRSDGRLHPVDIRHLPAKSGLDHAEAVTQGTLAALAQSVGDLLVFLPGAREIRQCQRLLEARLTGGVRICPLYGELSSEEQDAALTPAPPGQRKIILATNIAQTSLTVEGVTTVVDGGLVRVARFDLGAGANELETRRVSRASADQRAGRAGRLGPGQCFRLWSADSALPSHDAPEILATDLSRFALELAHWGVSDPVQLKLLDPPPPSSWNYAHQLLQDLGALDGQGRISTHGRELARLPTAPRRAHMLLMAKSHGLGSLAAWLAAVLDEKTSGHADLAQWLADALKGRVGNIGDANAQRRMRETANQLMRLIQKSGETGEVKFDENAVARLVSWAYPERLARRREQQGSTREVSYLCEDGGEACLAESDALSRSPWLAVAHWDPGPPRRIRLAAAIAESDVLADHAERIHWQREIRWDTQKRAVTAEEQRRLGALVLQRRPLRDLGAEGVRALLSGIRQTGLHALPWTEVAREWQARVQSLHLWRAEETWPDVSDAALLATLEDWLAPYVEGMTRLEHLSRLDLLEALNARFDYGQRQQLQKLTPTHLTVPTGSSIRLEYRPPEAPALHVKLQEMFGCVDTPTINDGRIKVVLHLLSPAQRPIAVTQDLAGFWSRGYADVKKDMKGRYPRHPWPDDPVAAAPTRRAKPRGT